MRDSEHAFLAVGFLLVHIRASCHEVLVEGRTMPLSHNLYYIDPILRRQRLNNPRRIVNAKDRDIPGVRDQRPIHPQSNRATSPLHSRCTVKIRSPVIDYNP